MSSMVIVSSPIYWKINGPQASGTPVVQYRHIVYFIIRRFRSVRPFLFLLDRMYLVPIPRLLNRCNEIIVYIISNNMCIFTRLKTKQN